MAKYTITYQLDLMSTAPHHIDAAYYAIEDGWVTFKDDKGKLLASVAAGTIWTIEKVA